MDKNLSIKKDICDSLNGRKHNIEKLISVFFGEKSQRSPLIKHYPRLYKHIVRNLNKMSDEKLSGIAKDLPYFKTGIKSLIK